MLCMALWIAAIVIIVRATSPPSRRTWPTPRPPTARRSGCGLAYRWRAPAWAGEQLVDGACPSGVWKYRGCGPAGADIGQGVALLIYVVQRFHIGDWHVYPMAATLAAGVFVAHLVLRDVGRLWAVESWRTACIGSRAVMSCEYQEPLPHWPTPGWGAGVGASEQPLSPPAPGRAARAVPMRRTSSARRLLARREAGRNHRPYHPAERADETGHHHALRRSGRCFTPASAERAR